MNTRRISQALTSLALITCTCASMAQDKTNITVLHFHGDCAAEFANVTDSSKASSQCGIITTLTNQFNASNKQNIKVSFRFADWEAFYDMLNSAITNKDPPTISLMHESALGDYVAQNLLTPLDGGFNSVGIKTSDFTDHAKTATNFGGKFYALPYDTHGWLWHINANELKKAGLVNANGSPLLPKSPEELLAHARRYKQATGKPYFAWSPLEEAANFWNLVTLVGQQKSNLFSDDGKKIDMHSKAVRNALELMSTLSKEGLMEAKGDYISGRELFVTGNSAIRPWGTWMVQDLIPESEKPGSPLKGGYSAIPFPQLYATKAAWANGHSWVMPKGGAKDEKSTKAALLYLKFLWDHDFDWSRTGVIPANKVTLASAEYLKLPMVKNIMEIGQIAVQLPGKTRNQRAVQRIVGEELVNMLTLGKAIDAVQRDTETRVNNMLAKAR